MMQRSRYVTAAIVLAVCVPAALPAQDASVTLFSSGRALVRRAVPAQLPSGVTTLPFALGNIAAGSFAVTDPGVTVVAVAYDPAYSEEALLRRNVGQQFTLVINNNTVVATLLGLDPERWLINGRVVFGRPGEIQWPREMVPLAPTAYVTLRSDRARSDVHVMYEAPGGTWSANYRLTLGAQGRIEGVAVIQGSTLDLRDAEVQLLAGDIGVRAPMAPPAPRMEMVMQAKAAADVGGYASEESVGEARLYTLPGRVPFIPGTQLVMPLFEPTPVRAERRYTVGGGLPFYGGFGQQEDEQEVPVEVAYRFDRKPGTAFGDLPLPAGSMNVFDVDRSGRLQLVGAGYIGHTAPGEELIVRTGTAFDVTARRTQTEFMQARVPGTPARTQVTVGYRLRLQNAKDSAVVVEVREDRGGEWSVIESSVPAQKRSATRSVFVVTVPAKGTATLTYRVRALW